MKIENWEKIKSVFTRVLEEPKEQRRDFLQEFCGKDSELCSEVKSLLAAYEETTKHIIEDKEFGVGSILQSDTATYEGKQFGHYKIKREIGRGGMGAVFLAERTDGEFEQQVALKIIRQTFAAPELEQRFRRERQILASLNHPNIAKLLDGGISGAGELFLVMEYVEGKPLLEFAFEQNQEINDRLRLFLKICSAVAHAHRNLVVHRDIKPLNILVTDDGEPKLLDFGLAKILDSSILDISQTETAFRAFTPAYASPEQMRGGNITTATDVYSLGVVFYELLTGERPFHFENKNYEEILRSIATIEPPRPSSVVSSKLNTSNFKFVNTTSPDDKPQITNGNNNNPKPAQNPKSLQGDLDNIALTALRKEPEQRYQSIEAFAQDIERHLNNLPIMARPQTTSYHAAKFFRRNKLSILAVMLIFLALTSGLTVALWQAGVARRERNRAEQRFNDVRQLSNALLFELSPKMERLPGSTEARQILVKRALEYLDSLSQETGDDLQLQSELATAYEKVGVLQGDSRKPSLSDFRGAIASLEKAQAIRRKLLEINPNDAENRRLLAENLRLLGIRRMYQNDVEGGIRDGKEAVSIYEKLVAENPDALGLQTALLETQIEDAASYVDLARFNEAIPLLQQTVNRIEELRRANADDADIARIHAKCLAYLGHSFSWESRQPEAEAEMTRAVEITESIAARFPNDTNLQQDLWKIYQIAAGIYEEIDDGRAFELCKKAQKIVEETIAIDRANLQAHHNLAMTFSRLGISAANLGKPDEGLAYLERAAVILSELQAKDPLNRGYDQNSSSVYKRVGDAKYKQRDLSGSLDAYEKNRATLEKQIELDPPNTRVQRNLALACRDLGWVHNDFIKITTGESRQAHLQAAKENYRRALDFWMKAESQNTLTEIDRKNMEEARVTIEKLEKMR